MTNKTVREIIGEEIEEKRESWNKELEKVQQKEPNTKYKVIHNKTSKTPTKITRDYSIAIQDPFYEESEIHITRHKRNHEKPDQITLHIKTNMPKNLENTPATATLNGNITNTLQNIPTIAHDLEKETGHDLPYTKILLDIHKDFQKLEQEENLFAPMQKVDLPYFTDKGTFVPLWLAQDIMDDHHFATHQQNDQLYIYHEGIYKPEGTITVKQEAQKRLERYRKTHYIKETIDTIKIENYTPPEKFNNPNNGIVVENGLLNLETLELKPHSPKHIHTTKIPWKYNPKAKCPEIKKFIAQVVNPDDVKIIQEMIGYCLIKNYPYAKAFMLRGEGANGKSTLLQLLEEFLGENNIAGPSLQQLLNNPFAKIELYGKLANIHSDLSADQLNNTGPFKMLTGGDTIYGEKKYQNPISFKNHAKLIYSANQLPKTKDTTEAFFRRWIIIDFPNTFTSRNPDTDPNLPNSLINEENMSGLLNWAIKGLKRIQEQGGFSQTESRKKIEERWIMETDSLRAFKEKALTTKKDQSIPKEALYELYKLFCDHNNIYTVKKQTLTKRLPTLLPKIQQYRPKAPEGSKKRPRSWKHLALKECFIKKNRYVQDVPGEYSFYYRRRENNIEEEPYKRDCQNTQDIVDTEDIDLETEIIREKDLEDLD